MSDAVLFKRIFNLDLFRVAIFDYNLESRVLRVSDTRNWIYMQNLITGRDCCVT